MPIETPLIGQTDQNTDNSPSSGIYLRKPTTPDRLKVPKAFKYPERNAKHALDFLEILKKKPKLQGFIERWNAKHALDFLEVLKKKHKK
ncbi:uncharacterized protein LOC133831260 [Humulus lupulus]|uniref:uncharacterized protein LOC133831260 n=1 Tax=Humulus lupulus TaxID=3486 RepID=UPI002B40CEB3|nr:uncharacterized protein LOC133831260 [Humulus lupulus]